MVNQKDSFGSLRILSVEDSQPDFELIRELILEAGYEPDMERVETEEDFVKSLQEKAYDIILADFKLPTFDAFKALENTKKIRPDIPFIVMSGSIGEETAIELIKQGSVDYVLKDRPLRLAAAIQRALEETHQKKARQKAEETLAKNHQLLRLAGKTAQFGGWQLDLATNQFIWSDIVCEIHEMPKGYSPSIEEVIQLSAPEWRDKTNEVFSKCAQEGIPFDEELELITRTGKRIWVRIIGDAVRDISGEIVAVQGSFQDISQKKRADRALQASENRFRSLVDNLPGVVYLCYNDARYTMTYLTNEVEDLTGYPASEFIEDRISFVDLYHPDDLPEIYQKVDQSVENHQPFHLIYRLQRRDGEWRWMEEWGAGVFENQDLKFLEGFIVDITERKAIEDALSESERIFQIALKNSPVTVFKQDANLRYTWIHNPNPGFQPKDAIGKTHAERFTPQDAEKLTTIKKQVLETGEGLHQIVKTSGQGLPEYLDMTIEPIKDKEGTVTGIICSSVDITKFRKAEEAQHQRLAELETIRRISKTFQNTDKIHEALTILLRETLTALDLPAGAIYLYDPEHNELIMEVGEGWFKAIEGTSVKPSQGITGKVFSSGKPHISKEFVKDPHVNPDTRGTIPEGWGGIAIPIMAFNETVGGFYISCQIPQEIQPYQIQLVESLAQIAGISLHRMALLEEALQRLEKLKSQHTIDQAIASMSDLPLTLEIICRQALNRLAVDAVGILLYIPHDQTLTYASSAGFKSGAYKKIKIKLNESHVAGRAAMDHKTIHLDDLATNPDASDHLKSLSAEGFNCYTAKPLIAKGQIKGVLETFHLNHFQHSTEWQNDLATLATQIAVAIDTLQMYDRLHQKNLELNNAYDATIEGWSLALTYRDEETEGHTLRVTELSLKLAKELGVKDACLPNIRYGALLHDIGKIGIPDSILLKPGPLTDEEWKIMKQHPRIAYNMLAPIDYLRAALDIPYYHHEKWDGSGYPSGLKGNQIPIAARIFAIIDVWDALRSDRPYRKAWSEEKTIDYIREQSENHFDPSVVEAFFKILEEEQIIHQ